MKNINFCQDNHYISQGYLKRWECCASEIWVYNILVSHENVPLWAKKNIKGIAYHPHLYTQKISGEESDEIEKWFSNEYESPAEGAIHKAVTDQHLTIDDWRKLVRFMALQDTRTPARLIEHLRSSAESVPKILNKVLNDLPTKLVALKNSGDKVPTTMGKLASSFPLQVTTEIKKGEKFGTIKAETAVGRASWIWSIRYLLENTANILHRHKWTIMRPAIGMNWITSDNPVVRLNYSMNGEYNFSGGWGRKGTELFLPLGPQHLLYTQVGYRPPIRGTRFSIENTRLIRRLIAEHAHRMVFSSFQDSDIPTFVSRKVNSEFFKYEKEQWDNWPDEQNKSEANLLSKQKNV